MMIPYDQIGWLGCGGANAYRAVKKYLKFLIKSRCSVVLITIRPGPVIHVWRDGDEVIAVPLTFDSALCLLRDLADAIRR